ncbi:MAG: TatD family hydrolase [Pseudomonadales bacterium]|nr:TatD family hydrolase [Pseudomonadales bacterium]
MPIFDTHCHYNLDPILGEWQTQWHLAQKNDITHTTIVGTDIQTSKQALSIAKNSKNLFASIGYHPGTFEEHAPDFVEGQTVYSERINTELKLIKNELLEMVSTGQPIAIGEIGLDYYRLRSKGLKREVLSDLQKKAFKLQLEIAAAHNLPVILHVRDQAERTHSNAYLEVLEIIKQTTPKKFVLHCVSGPLSYITAALELGAYIGFDGNITYPQAKHIREIFSITPTDKILLETDAPYLAPELHRGKICEPWMITETAKYLEGELKTDLAQIYHNSFSFFDINNNARIKQYG